MQKNFEGSTPSLLPSHGFSPFCRNTTKRKEENPGKEQHKASPRLLEKILTCSLYKCRAGDTIQSFLTSLGAIKETISMESWFRTGS